MGKLYGVGVGPGDPELVTLKAVKLIEECQIIVVPSSGENVNVAYTIAKEAVPHMEEAKLRTVDMPMIRDKEKLRKSHDAAASEIISWLEEGKDVAFLTLGDPTIYSTYSYVHSRVLEAGYETEIVPGVTSFCAAAARLNFSLTEGEEALHIIPASYEGVEEALKLTGTKVLMKSGKAIGKIKKHMLQMEKTPRVSMVERCGMEGECVFHSIEEIDENAGYFSLIIVKDKKQALEYFEG